MEENRQIIKALTISSIDIQNIKLTTLKKNKTVPILYNNTQLVFQTPFLKITSDKLKKTKFPHICQLDTVFEGLSKHKVDEFYHFIDSLELYIGEQVAKHSKWFSQKNILLQSFNKELENNVIHTRWPIDMQRCEFINETYEEVTSDSLHDNDLVKFIVEIPNLWIDNNKFGLSILVQKIMIHKYVPKIINEYVFTSDSELDDSDDICSLLESECKKVKHIPKKKSNKKKHTPTVELVKHMPKKHAKKKSEEHISDEFEMYDSDTSEDSD